MTLRRKAPLRSTTAPKRSTKGIRKINPERAKRRRDKYQAYLRSAAWREKKRLVRERSGGRCERIVAQTWIGVLGRVFRRLVRCPNPAKVCQHLTYARFGHENLEDLSDDCESCDRIYESARPWRAARRRALG